MGTAAPSVIKSFKDLLVWQRSMDLAVIAHRLSHQLPRHERFALSDQIRRAASSIPANIAEGAGRRHTKEYLYGLSVARGSLKELETHILLASRLGYWPDSSLAETMELIEATGKMLWGLSKSLRARMKAQ